MGDTTLGIFINSLKHHGILEEKEIANIIKTLLLKRMAIFIDFDDEKVGISCRNDYSEWSFEVLGKAFNKKGVTMGFKLILYGESIPMEVTCGPWGLGGREIECECQFVNIVEKLWQ